MLPAGYYTLVLLWRSFCSAVRTVLLLSKVRHTAELIIRVTRGRMENLILRSLSPAICFERWKISLLSRAPVILTQTIRSVEFHRRTSAPLRITISHDFPLRIWTNFIDEIRISRHTVYTYRVFVSNRCDYPFSCQSISVCKFDQMVSLLRPVTLLATDRYSFKFVFIKSVLSRKSINSCNRKEYNANFAQWFNTEFRSRRSRVEKLEGSNLILDRIFLGHGSRK